MQVTILIAWYSAWTWIGAHVDSFAAENRRSHAPLPLPPPSRVGNPVREFQAPEASSTRKGTGSRFGWRANTIFWGLAPKSRAICSWHFRPIFWIPSSSSNFSNITFHPLFLGIFPPKHVDIPWNICTASPPPLRRAKTPSLHQDVCIRRHSWWFHEGGWLKPPSFAHWTIPCKHVWWKHG